jgi:16S rRNA processing protein RimM
MSLERIPIAFVVRAHGIQGAAQVKALAGLDSSLPSIKQGWLSAKNQESSDVEVEIVSCRGQGSDFVVRFKGWDNREQTQKFAGGQLWVDRAALPVADDDSFYWFDLIGCKVQNLQGVSLGSVVSLQSTGVHDVLEIRYDEPCENRMRLIPFVSAYVQDVSLAKRQIIVDWNVSWDED